MIHGCINEYWVYLLHHLMNLIHGRCVHPISSDVPDSKQVEPCGTHINTSFRHDIFQYSMVLLWDAANLRSRYAQISCLIDGCQIDLWNFLFFFDRSLSWSSNVPSVSVNSQWSVRMLMFGLVGKSCRSEPVFRWLIEDTSFCSSSPDCVGHFGMVNTRPLDSWHDLWIWRQVWETASSLKEVSWEWAGRHRQRSHRHCGIRFFLPAETRNNHIQINSVA